MFNGEKGIFYLWFTRRLRQQYSTVTLTSSVGPILSGPTFLSLPTLKQKPWPWPRMHANLLKASSFMVFTLLRNHEEAELLSLLLSSDPCAKSNGKEGLDNGGLINMRGYCPPFPYVLNSHMTCRQQCTTVTLPFISRTCSILRLSYLLSIPTLNKTLTMNSCKFTESVLDDLHLVNESGARFWTLENDPTSCHETHV
jgi:hypothetical protein